MVTAPANSYIWLFVCELPSKTNVRISFGRYICHMNLHTSGSQNCNIADVWVGPVGWNYMHHLMKQSRWRQLRCLGVADYLLKFSIEFICLRYVPSKRWSHRNCTNSWMQKMQHCNKSAFTRFSHSYNLFIQVLTATPQVYACCNFGNVIHLTIFMQPREPHDSKHATFIK